MSSQAASSSRDRNGPRLVVWAPCMSPSKSLLPTLDPDSLYAATLLQSTRSSKGYSLTSVSPILNTRVPCLEDPTTGLTLADDLESIQLYSRKHSKSKDDDLVDEVSRSSQRTREVSSEEEKASQYLWARSKALERYILATLHPLIYQELFSQSLFHNHTAEIYQAGLPLLYKGSLINRLRKEVRLNLAKRARFMQSEANESLGAALSDSNTMTDLQQEEERERQILADRGGINKDDKRGKIGLAAFRGNGMLIEEKEKAARAFKEMRMRKSASEILDTIVEALGSQSYLFGSKKLSMVDVRLFSLLAPLLLPVDHHITLANSSLPMLLRSNYPMLVEYSERIQKLIWPIEVQSLLEANLSGQGEIHRKQMCLTPGWPSLPGRHDLINETKESRPMTIRLASSLGTICGQVYRITSSILPSKDSSQSIKGKERESTSTANDEKSKKPTMTMAEKQDARRVNIGKWIWISSAFIGIIATAFSSGLLAIEFIDTDENDRNGVEMTATPSRNTSDVNDGDEKDIDNTSDEEKVSSEIGEENNEEESEEADEDEEYEMVYVDGDTNDEDEDEDDEDISGMDDREKDDEK